MTSFNDADAVWQRYPTLPRAWVDTRVAAVILGLERERDAARAAIESFLAEYLTYQSFDQARLQYYIGLFQVALPEILRAQGQ